MKILVLYASLTGNTESMAEAVAEGIKAAGAEPVLKEVMDVQVADLLAYEGFVFGSYTWGDGELPDEFLDFYDDLEDVDLSGRKAGVFGSGETAYVEFCASVDLLSAKLAERGAELVGEGLKIELNPAAAEKEACRELGRLVALAVFPASS
jgi:flavodoxin I